MRPMGEEELSLTVADAWRMSDEQLSECFWEVAREIIETFGDDLPEDFPRYTRGGMTRVQMVAAIAAYAYFFGPSGHHAKPPRRRVDARQLALGFEGGCNAERCRI
jgi:hypothetical protein